MKHRTSNGRQKYIKGTTDIPWQTLRPSSIYNTHDMTNTEAVVGVSDIHRRVSLLDDLVEIFLKVKVLFNIGTLDYVKI